MAPKDKSLLLTNIAQLHFFVFALVVVQLHPGHREERERTAYSGGAAALRRGQSGASRSHRPSQPGNGQKEQRPNRSGLPTLLCEHVALHLRTNCALLSLPSSRELRFEGPCR